MRENARLLTAAELADILAIAPKVARQWKREGRIPAAVDEPGCIRFDLSEVLAALAARAAEALKHQHA
jgi:predicted site-specific integrase-resolvase